MTEQEDNYKILNAPEKIFIQIGEFEGEDIDFKDLEPEYVTWTDSKVFDNDIEYVSISDRDKFAMDFAEWHSHNTPYIFDTEKNCWINFNAEDRKFPYEATTIQLLDLYKQSLKTDKG